MKKIVFLFPVFLFAFAQGFAQQPKEHPKGMYFDSENQKLYTQEKLPVYFFMSNSPDGSNPKRLVSDSEHANPMYFDGHGVHYLKHDDFHLEEKVNFTIYADGKTPATKISYGKAPTYQSDSILYTGKKLELNLDSHDELAGVKQVYLSIDGAEYKEYSDPLQLDSEKPYTFRFYAVDNVGNAEKLQTQPIVADLTSPNTTHSIEGDQTANILSPRTKIHLTAKDQISGVKYTYYQFDDGQKHRYGSYISLARLKEGNHTLTYYSEDQVKNQETKKTYQFFLDRSAPVVVDEVLGNQHTSGGRLYSSGRTKFKLSAADNKAGVKEIYYSLNRSEYKLYNEPFYLPSKTGTLLISYYAVDNVNNKGNTNQRNKNSAATYVDLTGPELNHAYIGPSFTIRDTVYINKTTKIKLIASDSESGMQKITYQIDQKNEKTYAEPFRVETAGLHHVDFDGFDNVENSNHGRFYFVVDNTPPEVYPRFSITPVDKKNIDGKALDVYPVHAVLFFAATDTHVGYDKIYYRINGSGERRYSSVITGFRKGTHYTVDIRILDKLGNEKTETIEFYTEQ